MKNIYVVNTVDLEPFSDWLSGPLKAFTTKAAAEAFVYENAGIVFEANEEEHEYGWGVSTYITELELVE